MLRRRLCSLVGRLDHLEQRCLVSGRVLAASPAQARFVLADRSGTLAIRCAAPPAAGAIVEVELSLAGGEARAEAVRHHGGGGKGFGAADGEYYRLRTPVDRVARLRLRARALAATRRFFDGRGYLEVQTPLRVRAPGLEPHLRALPSGDRFLITSPEYHLKRLLAGGLERIYSLGPCWRDDETGAHHLTEFTMLEWYRAHSGLDTLMRETELMIGSVARELLGRDAIEYRGHALSLRPPFARLTVAEAFAVHAGVELGGVTEAAQLRRRAEAAGLGPFAEQAGFDAIFSEVLVERVEPALAALGPLFLYDFPAPLAALARLKPDDPSLAERFELYAGGLELANAFGELTDAEEQAARLRAEQDHRRRAGREVYPIDERFLAALREGIPPSAGIALGFDRLLMLLCDAGSIDEVVAFAPHEV